MMTMARVVVDVAVVAVVVVAAPMVSMALSPQAMLIQVKERASQPRVMTKRAQFAVAVAVAPPLRVLSQIRMIRPTLLCAFARHEPRQSQITLTRVQCALKLSASVAVKAGKQGVVAHLF
jgi:hypothetical protein